MNITPLEEAQVAGLTSTFESLKRETRRVRTSSNPKGFPQILHIEVGKK
jgi:hypothetical protein